MPGEHSLALIMLEKHPINNGSNEKIAAIQIWSWVNEVLFDSLSTMLNQYSAIQNDSHMGCLLAQQTTGLYGHPLHAHIDEPNLKFLRAKHKELSCIYDKVQNEREERKS